MKNILFSYFILINFQSMVIVANCCNFQIFLLGQSYFNDNNSYAVIKAEVPERMMELNNHTVSIPCPICGMGETGTHNHYGGRACTSCRAFFRRSVQTNSYKVSKIIICLHSHLIIICLYS